MEKVWKCDFCYTTTKTVDGMDRHESACSFNPQLKLCRTCDHQTPMDYCMDYECKIHDLSHYIDVDDREIKCVDWRNNEERTKKLKKLLDKIKNN